MTKITNVLTRSLKNDFYQSEFAVTQGAFSLRKLKPDRNYIILKESSYNRGGGLSL